MIDFFGAKVVPGKNLQFLNNIKAFYKEKNITIIGYQLTKPCDGVRSKPSILRVETSLPRCHICRTELYNLVPDQETGEVNIKQKTHLVLSDINGSKYKTCKGISLCMKKAGWKDSWKESENSLDQVDPPAMLDFMDMTRPNSDPNSQIEIDRVKAMNVIYERDVAPFLDKWRQKFISKQNFSELMADLKTLEEFSNYLFDERIDVFLSKVYNFIGVS